MTTIRQSDNRMTTEHQTKLPLNWHCAEVQKWRSFGDVCGRSLPCSRTFTCVCVCVHSWSSSSGRRQQISTSDLSIVTGAVAATAASETRSGEFRSPPRLQLQYIVSHSILQPIKAYGQGKMLSLAKADKDSLVHSVTVISGACSQCVCVL